VVTDTWDVGRHLDAVAQSHAGHLAKRRVGLLRRGGVHTRADAPSLRASLQRRRLGLAQLRLAALADQLLDRRHWACLSLRPPGRTSALRYAPCDRHTRSGVSPRPRPGPLNPSPGLWSTPTLTPAERKPSWAHARVARQSRARGERVPTVRTLVKIARRANRRNTLH